jgi:hypothetical protein
VAEGELNIVPEVLVTGGSSLDGLAAALMRSLANGRVTAPAEAVQSAVQGAVEAKRSTVERE